MSRDITIKTAGVFESPFKAIWSESHRGIFVIGKHIAYFFDPYTFKSKPFHSTEEYTFKDIDSFSDGNVVLALQSLNGTHGEVKVLAPNLFSIIRKIDVYEGDLMFSRFSASGDVVAVSKKTSGKNSFCFYLIQTNKNTMPGEGIVETKGDIVGLESNIENDLVFAVSSGGDVVLAPTKYGEYENFQESSSSWVQLSEGYSSESSLEIMRFKPTIIGNIGDGVTSFSFGLKSNRVSASAQNRVRVFVGSRPWSNDRWDSGEISTAKTSMLYGGGDNLVPGQNYWVHVSVWHDNSGWSSPQIRKFTMPNSRRYADDLIEEYSSESTELRTTSSSVSSISSSSMSSVSSSTMVEFPSSVSSSFSREYEEGSFMALAGINGYYAISPDYGNTWTEKSFMQGDARPNLIMSSSAKHQTVAAWGPTGSSFEIWVSNSGGGNWSKKHIETNLNALGGLGIVAEGRCSSDGRYQMFSFRDNSELNVVNSSDFGATWERTAIVETGDPRMTLSMAMMSKDGKNRIVGPANKYFYKSTNYGNSWSLLSPSGLISDYYYASNGSSYLNVLAMAGESGDIFISRDFGNSWIKRLDTSVYLRSDWRQIGMSENGQYIAYIAATVSTTGWMIRISRDYGVSWKEGPFLSTGSTASYGGGISISKSGKYMLAGCFFESAHRAYFSEDYGVTWSIKNSPIQSPITFITNVAISSGYE